MLATFMKRYEDATSAYKPVNRTFTVEIGEDKDTSDTIEPCQYLLDEFVKAKKWPNGVQWKSGNHYVRFDVDNGTATGFFSTLY
jgi:hypothetical protein